MRDDCHKTDSHRMSGRMSERGSFLLFFAAAILPLIGFMMLLSLDISVYFKAEQKLQEAADDAALLAWRYLPYQSLAINAVKDLVKQRGLSGSLSYAGMATADGSSSANFNDEFEVVLEQQIQPVFGSFISGSIKFPIRSIARSRSTPVDIFIAVDRSQYIAPASINEIWGSFSDSSKYFRDSAPFTSFIDHKTSLPVSREQAAIYMTQLCFNLYFSQLKSTALNIYEYLAGAGRNGIGMGVFPGIELDPMFTLRPLLRPAEQVRPNIADSGEAMALQGAASGFFQDSYYYDKNQLGASSWCAAAAEQEMQFKAPVSYGADDSAPITKIWKPAFSGTNERQVSFNSSGEVVFNPAYQSFLTLRESLWSAVAKNSLPDSSAVIDSAIVQLAQGPDSESYNHQSVRGGLTGTSTKTAIILAGDVPYYRGMRFERESDPVAARLASSISIIRELVVENPELRVKVIFIIADDPARPASDSLNEIEERSLRLGMFFEQQQELVDLRGRLILHSFYARDFKALNQDLLASILLEDRRRVLSY